MRFVEKNRGLAAFHLERKAARRALNAKLPKALTRKVHLASNHNGQVFMMHVLHFLESYCVFSFSLTPRFFTGSGTDEFFHKYSFLLMEIVRIMSFKTLFQVAGFFLNDFYGFIRGALCFVAKEIITLRAPFFMS